MAQFARSALVGWSFAVALVTLPGCPELLPDNFDMAGGGGTGVQSDAPCAGSDCDSVSVDAGKNESSDEREPESPDVEAPAADEPEAQAPDASAPSEENDAAVIAAPDCWVVALDDTTHPAAGSDNCLEIHGWNDVVTDPESASTMTLSYDGGDVCFAGTVDSDGWGAVYNFTLADENTWNATSRGVGGFELAFTGSELPLEVVVVYSDSSRDYCRAVTASALVSVPFESTHPDCTETPGAQTPDTTRLTYLRLVFGPAGQSYEVDTCVEVRAAR